MSRLSTQIELHPFLLDTEKYFKVLSDMYYAFMEGLIKVGLATRYSGTRQIKDEYYFHQPNDWYFYFKTEEDLITAKKVIVQLKHEYAAANRRMRLANNLRY